MSIMDAPIIEKLRHRNHDDDISRFGEAGVERFFNAQTHREEVSHQLSTASFARDSELLRGIIRDDPDNRPSIESINEASSAYLEFFKDDEASFYRQNKNNKGAIYANSAPLRDHAISIWNDTRTEETKELAGFMIDRFNWIGKDDYKKAFKIASDEDIPFSEAWNDIRLDK